VDPTLRAFPFERRFEVLDGLGEHVVVAGRKEFRDEGHGWGLFVDGGPRVKRIYRERDVKSDVDRTYNKPAAGD